MMTKPPFRDNVTCPSFHLADLHSPQLCLSLDSTWQNPLIKSERFVQQARRTLALDEDSSSGVGKEVTLQVESAKGS